MKTKLSFIHLIIIILFSIGCENDSDDLPQEKTINGTWHLVNIHGGLAFRNINYSKGDVKWVFNQTDSTLFVQNKIGNDHSFMLHDGSYTFHLEQHDDSQFLFADNDDYRMIIISMNNSLIINDGLNDGYTAEFIR